MRLLGMRMAVSSAKESTRPEADADAAAPRAREAMRGEEEPMAGEVDSKEAPETFGDCGGVAVSRAENLGELV